MRSTSSPVRLAAFAVLLLAGCAHTPPDDPSDPLEKVNRKVYAISMTVDHYALRPVAKGYVDVTPAPVRTGISNFFVNLGTPKVIVNDLLQLKLLQCASDTGRFLMNSTIGIAGFIDVATPVGLVGHDEDLGQTFGHYGVGPGWFLMIPLIGPSDNRDLVGYAGDYFLGPGYWVPGRYDVELYATTAVGLVNTRSQLLDIDQILQQQLDQYIFVRTAYLQRRQSLVYDGHPPKEEFDDEQEDTTPPPPVVKP